MAKWSYNSTKDFYLIRSFLKLKSPSKTGLKTSKMTLYGRVLSGPKVKGGKEGSNPQLFSSLFLSRDPLRGATRALEKKSYKKLNDEKVFFAVFLYMICIDIMYF